MAVGDVISGLASIGIGGNLDFQPAAGVEVMISALGALVSGSNNISITNGTLNAVISIGNTNGIMNSKIFINNTNYLRINNGTGGAVEMGYTGIQIK